MPSYAVIGGSRGVGLELVRQLAADTKNVVFVTVRNKAASAHLNDLVAKSTARNIHVLQADVVDHRAVKAAATDVAKQTGGSLDVLIYNAARMEMTNMFHGLTDYEDEDKLDAEFLESFKVNVLGAVHSVNAFLPLLRKGAAKKVVMIGSEGGKPGFIRQMQLSGMAAYGVTKAAEEVVMTKYAVLLEPEGFTVVAISPGLVDVSATATEKLDGAIVTAVENQIARKLLTPEESVGRILRLVSGMSTKDNALFMSYVEYP